MNWRTVWIAALMLLCLSSITNIFDLDCISAFGTLGGGLLVVIGVARWAYLRLERWNTFALFVVDHPPPGESMLDWGEAHFIPLHGNSHHWIQVVCNRGINLENFNVRFIPADEIQRQAGDLTDMRAIVILRDVFPTQITLFRGSLYREQNDPWGGINGIFNPPVAMGAGESLFLQIRIGALQNWSGMLRFQALDENNDLRWACKEVRVG